MANVPEFNESNFDAEVLQSDKPVLVDFYTATCGPCRQLAPVIAELAEEYSGRVKIGKVDAWDAQGVATRYGVMNVPTLIVFRNGQPVQTLVGARPKSQLKQMLDAVSG
jgi:thioredoxin 1